MENLCWIGQQELELLVYFQERSSWLETQTQVLVLDERVYLLHHLEQFVPLVLDPAQLEDLHCQREAAVVQKWHQLRQELMLTMVDASLPYADAESHIPHRALDRVGVVAFPFHNQL